jgi:hypothetical protein
VAEVIMKSRKLKELAQLMIIGWTEDKNMGWVVQRYAYELGIEASGKEAFEALSGVFGGYIKGDMPVRAFVAKNMRKLSDAAWDRRSNERLTVAAEADLKLKGAKGSIQLKVRTLDTRNDWSTVK